MFFHTKKMMIRLRTLIEKFFGEVKMVQVITMKIMKECTYNFE